MKKLLNKIVLTAGIIFILTLIAESCLIQRVDSTPYFETQYYKNTIENLYNVISNREIIKGKLYAGFASINITPHIINGNDNPSKNEFSNIKLSGFGDGKFATGVHDSIYAKAITIDISGHKTVFISADLLIIAPEVVEKTEEKLKEHNISRSQLFFGATHTHSSIGNCIHGFVGEKFQGEYQPEVVEWLSAKLVKLILQSLSDVKPASFAHGDIHVPNLVANRIDKKTGRINDKLTVLSIIQNEGKKAVIGIFAAHPTVIGTWNNQLSGDYPGYFQRTMENKGIDLAMFFGGTLGSHTNKGIGEKFEKAEYIGKTLADSMVIAINKMEYTDSVVFSNITSKIETPKLQILYVTKNRRLSPKIGQKLMPKINSVHIQGLSINNFIWLTQPCELSGELALDLQNSLELKGFNSAITSLNGQYLGYIIPAKYYFTDKYEARIMGWYGPWMADYIMELNYTIADSLTKSKMYFNAHE